MKLSKVVEVDQENCVNCHRCIAVCPVKYCNDGSGDHVTINDDLCIGCGECLKACTHNARMIVDDFQLFLKSIKNKEKIVAIVAPAVAANFPDTYLNFNGWLKSLGVSALFDVSFGAELTVKSYLEHVKQNKPKSVIAQPCPAIVSFVEIYHPELLKYLAPADSPMMHTIKLVKHFYPQFSNHKFLIVSPCVAKKREFEEVGFGDFNVTIKKFTDYIQHEQINLAQFSKVDFDNAPAERAVLFSTPGGLLRTAQREFPEIVNLARKIEGPNTVYHYLSNLEKDIKKGIAPLLVDCLNCEQGCNGGTGTAQDKTQDEIEAAIEKRNLEMQQLHKSKSIFKNKQLAHRKLQKTINKFWKKDIYNRNYKDLSNENFKSRIVFPNEIELDKVYKELKKEKPSDFLNCGGCGYNTCEQMATAIFNGINKKENCHHYQSKYFTESVHLMLYKMEKFSEGDLSVELNSNTNDEVGNFYSGFNKAMSNIRNFIKSLLDAITAVASAANQISSSTEEMAAGAQEQSSQTTEVAAAVEQMTKTIYETTKNTGQAAEASKNAGKVAKEGGNIVEETIIGMNRISDVVTKSAETVQELGKSSNQIGEIVQVIDDIADQTNLLALNAAIEAARAGEQGRGFAVVADEVRKLAERTTKATKEIATMIKQIQKDTAEAVISMQTGKNEVNNGKQLALKAGDALTEIISGADKVVDIVTQVASASEEQSSASEQISKNIESISSVTQQSASGVQQIAHASEDLNRLTLNLQELIAQFKLDGKETQYAVRKNGKLIHV